MEIHLDPEIFEQVKNGTKNVEARVNDEKRRLIQKGDIITILKRPEEKEELRVRVTQKRVYKDFEELANAYPIERLYSPDFTKEQYLALLSKFYSNDEIAEDGVVAIHFELLEDYRSKRIKKTARIATFTSIAATIVGVVLLITSYAIMRSLPFTIDTLIVVVLEMILATIFLKITKQHALVRDSIRKELAPKHRIWLIGIIVLHIMGPYVIPSIVSSVMNTEETGASMSLIEVMTVIMPYMIMSGLYFVSNLICPVLMLSVLNRVSADRLEPEELAEQREEREAETRTEE